MLAEAIVAVGISLLTLGAVMMLNAQQLKLVKSSRETNAASLLLQDRIEQFRILSWQKFTDADYLRDNYLASRPASAALLPGVSEKVKVTAWPDANACTPILIEYEAGASPVVLLSGAGLTDQGLVKVEMTATWKSKDNRPRERSYSSIISNSGVTRVSLPAFGNTTGSTATTATPPPTTTTTPPPTTATPTPTPTPTSSTPTPVPGNNGNGKGNTGGKNGKG